MISCIILVCMSIVYAQMTPDFAADLADVFWHMTWDLCTNFVMFFLIHMTWELCADLTGRYFPFV